MKPKPAQIALVLAIVGGLIYVAVTLSKKKDEKKDDKAGNVYGEIVKQAAKLAAPVVKEATTQLTDEHSDLRQHFANVAGGVQKVGNAFGVAADPGARRARSQKAMNEEFRQREDAERFARLVHQRLARADVEQWVIQEDGTIFIYYRGQKRPFRQDIPVKSGTQRLAWAFEAPARALGVAIQRGRRIGTPFVAHVPPAYSDSNPYAIPSQTVSGQQQIADSPFTKAWLANQLASEITSPSQKRFLKFPDQQKPTDGESDPGTKAEFN